VALHYSKQLFFNRKKNASKQKTAGFLILTAAVIRKSNLQKL
jgi:hypothetical protein